MHQNVRIQPMREILEVIEVVFQAPERIFGRARRGLDLGPPGQARLHRVALAVKRNTLGQDVREFGPVCARSNETHVPAQYVPQVRKRVQAPTRDKTLRAIPLSRIDASQAETVKREWLATQARAFLPVHQRAAR